MAKAERRALPAFVGQEAYTTNARITRSVLPSSRPFGGPLMGAQAGGLQGPPLQAAEFQQGRAVEPL